MHVPRQSIDSGALRAIAAAIFAVALTACGGGSDRSPPAAVAPPPAPAPASAVIGPAGGSLRGPAGVELIVPPGALTEEVTVRIARSSTGAPPLPPGIRPDVPIYEITPHDLEFLQPVQVRLPLDGPAPELPAVLVASPTEPWTTNLARIEGQTVIVERPRLSWYCVGCFFPGGCSDPDPERLQCIPATVFPNVAVVPASALQRGQPLGPGGGFQSVIASAATLNLNIDYAAPRDCVTSPRMVVTRTGPTWGSNPTRVTLFDGPVVMASGPGPSQNLLLRSASQAGGTLPLAVPIDASLNGEIRFAIDFQCRNSSNRLLLAGQYGQYLVNIPVGVPPAITQPPLPQTITAGGGATFTVAATGTPAPTYAWTINGTAVGGGAFTRTTALGTCTGSASTSNGGATLSLSSVSFPCDGVTIGVAASNGVNPSAASSAVLRVSLPNPTVTTHPQSVTVTAGQPATFTAAIANAPHVQWERNGVLIPGATSPSYTLSTTTTADNGSQFRLFGCTLPGPSGTCIYTNAATLTINTAPTVTTHPQSVTVTAGQPATFTAAIANAPFVQWERDGVLIPGATSSSYTLSTTTTADNGSQFRLLGCTLPGPSGTCIYTNAATLTINRAPTINLPPLPQAITAGGGATFTVTATGTPTPSYAWTLNGTAVGSGAFTIGSCTGSASTSNGGATLSLTAVSVGCSSAAVGVTVSNIAGSVSASATLTVNAPPPSVTTQPQNVTVTAGQPATFTAAIANAPFVQWARNGVPIPGATSQSYTIAATTAADNGAAFSLLGCTQPGPSGLCVNTSTATLTVNAPPPSVTTQPQNVAVVTGQPATFTAAIANAPFLQWLRNSVPIPGATSQSYTIAATTAADNGAVFSLLGCTQPGPSGLCVNTRTATLTVSLANVAPAITQLPLAQTITAGGGATFTVTATGTPTPSYAWTLNGTAVGSGAFTIGSCTGSASTSNVGATLSLTSVTQGCSGFPVGVTVSNIAGSVSASATLTVNAPQPSVTTQPQSVTVTAGQPATFTAAIANAPFLQWVRNSVPIAGATSQSYTIAATTAADNGAVFWLLGCTQPGPGGNCVSTSTARLTVNPTNAAPAITQPPLAQTITAGGGATFTVTATGTPTPQKAWSITTVPSGFSNLSNGNISINTGAGICSATVTVSADGNSVTLGSVSAACNGATIGVDATNGIPPIASASATLTVNPAGTAPVITAQPTACFGQAGLTGGCSFSLLFSGSPTPTVTWRIGVTSLASSGSYSGGSCSFTYTTIGQGGRQINLQNMTAACNGSQFSALVSNSAGSVTSVSVTLGVQDVAVINGMQVLPGNEGETASASVNASGPDLRYQWLLTYDDSPVARTIPGATAATYTSPVLTPGYRKAQLMVRVCAGLPEPGFTPGGAPTNDAHCVYSGRYTLLNDTYPVGVSGACFGGPTGWCYRSPVPQANELTGLVMPAGSAPLVAVGYGTVLASTDYGANWTARFPTPRLDFRGVARTSSGSRLLAPVAATVSPAVSGGIYASDDDGATWNAMLTVAPGASVRDVVVAPNGTAVAAGSSLWLSTNGGTTWTAVGTAALTSGDTVERLAVRESTVAGVTQTIVLAATQQGDILRSTDGGATWNRVLAGGARLNDIAIGPSTDPASRGRAIALQEPPSLNSIWISNDGGATWTLEPGVNAFHVAAGVRNDGSFVIMDNSERTFVGTYPQSSGLTWTNPPIDWPNVRSVSRWRLAFSDERFGAAPSSEGFAVGRHGAMMRMPAGSSAFHWAGGGFFGSPASGARSNITAIESSGIGTLLMVRGGQVLRSTDGGTTWNPTGGQRADDGVNAVSWRDLNTAFVVFTMSGTGHPTLARSDNQGATWTTLGDMPSGQLNGVEITTNGGGFLIGNDGNSGQWAVFKMTNATAWSPVYTPNAQPLTVRALAPDNFGQQAVLVGTADGKILRTGDSGSTWGEITPGATGAIRHIARVNASTALLAADNGLWRSTDAGLTWTRVYNSAASGSMTAVAVDPSGTKCIAAGVVGVLTGDCLAAPESWTVVDLPFVGEPMSASWAAATQVLVGARHGALLINRNSGMAAALPPASIMSARSPGKAAQKVAAPPSQRILLPAHARVAPGAATARSQPLPQSAPQASMAARDGNGRSPPPLRIGPDRQSLYPDRDPAARARPPQTR
jgi:photosystem II stability/assembly factor-like uncharacterized protein